MVEIKNIEYFQGDFGLFIEHLSIPAHHCHALLGPSGAGKSTLLHLLLGLKQPRTGDILIEGRSILHLPPHKRGFGYVPQHLALFPHLNVKENIHYPLKAQKRTPDRAFLDELFTLSGLGPLLGRFPKSLSGGERQRVALVRALAAKPRLLLLDEPFSALDPNLKYELWELLQRLQQELRLTILLITHNLQEAFTLSHHCSVMQNGSIVQSDETKRLFYRPKKLSVAKYLGFHNIFEAIGEKKGIYLPDLRQSFCSELVIPKGEKRLVAIHPRDIVVGKKECNNLEGKMESMDMYHYKVGRFWPKGVSRYLQVIGEGGEWIHIPPSAFFVVD